MTHPAPHAASLDTAYSVCRGLHRTHGRSYYLATKLLPAWKRRHVHALYGFTRYTDDIVDVGGKTEGPHRARRLDEWAGQFYAAIEGTRSSPGPTTAWRAAGSAGRWGSVGPCSSPRREGASSRSAPGRA